MSVPKTAAAQAQPTKTARKRSTSTCRRKSSTSDGASSAYSIDLRGADQVLRRPLHRRPEAREHEEREERAGDDPERARLARSGSQPKRTPAATAQATVTRDRDVGAVDVDRPERRVGLVVAVQEEEGDRGRRDEREDVRRAQARPRRATILRLRPMRSRVIWRRSATAIGVYVATVLGFLTTVVATRELGVARLRAVRRRDRRVDVLPAAARPDDRGGARQVRLPLRRGRALGAAAAPVRGRARVQARSAACSRGSLIVALAPFAKEVWGAGGVVLPMLIAVADLGRAGARERRRRRDHPARPLRRARRRSSRSRWGCGSSGSRSAAATASPAR